MMTRTRRRPAARRLGRLTIPVLRAAAMTVGLGAGASSAQAASIDNGAGLLTQTTASAVTLSEAANGAGAASNMPNLQVTVSQTQNLQNQAVQISWTGATRQTTQGNDANGYSPMMQVFQCWAAAGETAPNPQHCQFSQYNMYLERSMGLPGNTSTALTPQSCLAWARQQGYDLTAADCRLVSSNYLTWWGGQYQSTLDWPFTPAPESPIQGSLTGAQANIDNKYWTSATDNTLYNAINQADGTGQVSFEVQTGVESNGLGCGFPQAGSGTPRACWLVVVPRLANPKATDGVGGFATSSPFLSANWRNALYVKQSFRSTSSPCPASRSGDVTVQGTDMMSNAFSSWQTMVCQQPGARRYSLITGNDQQSVTSAATGSTMALTTGAGDASPGLTYAPLTLTAPTVSFYLNNWYTKTQIPTVRLSPRLLAKLLTYSYSSATHPQVTGKLSGAPFENMATAANPYNLVGDPEFQALNPNFPYLAVSTISVSYGNSEYATQVWRYLWADADARAFLNGQADPWGMKVNPYYSSNPSYVNAFNSRYRGVTGTSQGWTVRFTPASVTTYPLVNFPKSDPTPVYPFVKGPGLTSGQCDIQSADLMTAYPYESNSLSAARDTLRGLDMTAQWQQSYIDCAWSKYVTSRQYTGSYAVMAMTDAPSASQFGVRTAALGQPLATATSKTSVATARVFVAPSTATIQAAGAAMATTSQSTGVMGLDYAKTMPATAYPLTMPVYAAASASASISAATRQAWAQLIRYAVGDAAQTSGTVIGQLPYGYAPEPLAWRIAALNAADRIERGVAMPTRPASSTASPGLSNSSSAGIGGMLGSGTGSGGKTSVTLPSTPSAGNAGNRSSAASGPGSSAGNPSAGGRTSGALAGAATPGDGGSPVAAAIPIGLASAAAAGFAIPVLKRRYKGPMK